MIHSTEGDEEPTLESQVDTDRIEQMRAVLNETRLGLVQQLLAADSGRSPSKNLATEIRISKTARSTIASGNSLTRGSSPNSRPMTR